METTITLKYSDECAILDSRVFAELSEDPALRELEFFENLRLHSSGCVVFQKTTKREYPERGYRTKTIYLHKLIAERYLSEFKVGNATLVGTHNGDKLDCRIENLVYRNRAVASRQRRTTSKVGYTGVYKEQNRYRAVISQNRRSIHIGMYATPEEAALAYNRKSLELFGSDGKINIVRKRVSTSGSNTHSGQSKSFYPKANSVSRDKGSLRKHFASNESSQETGLRI